MGLIIKCRVCDNVFWVSAIETDEMTTDAMIRTLNRRGGFYCEKHAHFKNDNVIVEVENDHKDRRTG